MSTLDVCHLAGTPRNSGSCSGRGGDGSPRATPGSPRGGAPRNLGQRPRPRGNRLQPPDVGLPPGSRRRTAGLRREEVAMLASLSVTYYTFLEQGRPVRPSAQVLDALAAALRMSAAERRYLAVLAHRPDGAGVAI